MITEALVKANRHIRAKCRQQNGVRHRAAFPCSGMARIFQRSRGQDCSTTNSASRTLQKGHYYLRVRVELSRFPAIWKVKIGWGGN